MGVTASALGAIGGTPLIQRSEGIFAGTSTGLNVAGAIAVARELGPGRTVVTVAVDAGLKYLAGDLFGH